MELFSTFLCLEYTFPDCKQYVGAEINTLMSNPDVPSISCRNLENARPIRDGMDGKEFISRQSRHFLL